MNKKIVSMILGMAILFYFPQPALASQTVSSESKVTVDVTADIAGEYYVTIPKTVKIDSVSKSAEYMITVSGDISGAERIAVVPEEKFVMSQKGKESVSATVMQDKTTWGLDEFDTTGSGVVLAEGLSSGNWRGSFSFEISLITE